MIVLNALVILALAFFPLRMLFVYLQSPKEKPTKFEVAGIIISVLGSSLYIALLMRSYHFY